MFRILEKGGLIIRREENSIYIRGDMGDYGDQRAIGERKTEGRRKRRGRDCDYTEVKE